MDREQISFIADILGIVAGLMAILGIGGILSWSILHGRRSLFSDRVLMIFGYSIKTFLCLVATFVLFPLFWLLADITSSIFGDGRFRGLEEVIATGYVPHIVGALISGLLFVPLWIVTCACIYTSSLAPLFRLGRIVTGTHSAEATETESVSDVE